MSPSGEAEAAGGAPARSTAWRADLHVHTVASPDSRLEVAEALRAAVRAGVDGIALTDHNSVGSLRVARKLLAEAPEQYLGSRRVPLVLIPGVEVSTREGHLLALFVEECPRKDRPLAETVESVHAQGGLSILSHPFRRTHGAASSLKPPYPPLDGIETLNGHNYHAINLRAGHWARALGLPTTGGSDAHSADEVGRCFTDFSWTDPFDPRKMLERNPHPGGDDRTRAGGLGVGIGNAVKRVRRGFGPV